MCVYNVNMHVHSVHACVVGTAYLCVYVYVSMLVLGNTFLVIVEILTGENFGESCYCLKLANNILVNAHSRQARSLNIM